MSTLSLSRICCRPARQRRWRWDSVRRWKQQLSKRGKGGEQRGRWPQREQHCRFWIDRLCLRWSGTTKARLQAADTTRVRWGSRCWLEQWRASSKPRLWGSWGEAGVRRAGCKIRAVWGNTGTTASHRARNRTGRGAAGDQCKRWVTSWSKIFHTRQQFRLTDLISFFKIFNGFSWTDLVDLFKQKIILSNNLCCIGLYFVIYVL